MKELEIKGFQGHTNTLIEVAPKGITAITGKSQAGKSSIERAVRWIRHNTPKGTAFIHNGAKECSVRIDTVTRVRNNDLNGYLIEGTEGHLAVLTLGVPDKILDELNLGPDNIQSQHTSIFLLDQSPGKVATKLSELVDLEAPIQMLKLIKQKRKGVHTTMNALALNISSCENKLNVLKDIPEAQKGYLALKALNDDLSAHKIKYAELRKVIEVTAQCKNDILAMPDISALPELKKLTTSLRAAWKDQGRLAALRNLVTVAKEVQGKIQTGVELFPLLHEVRTVQAQLDRLLTIKRAVQVIKPLKVQLRVLHKDNRVLLKKYKVAKDAYVPEVQTVKCPKCGTDVEIPNA